jgi:hypothetical protein
MPVGGSDWHNSRMSRPRIGSSDWEIAGGPAPSIAQRIGLLAGMGCVLAGDASGRLSGAILRRWRGPEFVDLDGWAPPDTPATRAAEAFLHESSSPEFIAHSHRCYYFSAIAYEHSTSKPDLDREALYLAVLMHDVGLFAPQLDSEHCFTVTGARHARRIADEFGWDRRRVDKVAAAITANLNPFVPAGFFGAEAHYFRVGGLIDVLAQGWKVHPDNARTIIERHPRDGFGADTARVIREEIHRNPGCRFACYGPAFPALVRATRFRGNG